MRVLLNAPSIKEGGARVLLFRLLAAMRELRPDIEWIVAANPLCSPPAFLGGSVTWVPIPWIDRSPLHVLAWYEHALPAMIRKHGADVVFSHTNFLPRQRLACPSLLLIQQAGYFSPEFDRLMRLSLPSWFARELWRQRALWVRHSAERATVVTVQTQALANRLKAITTKNRDEIIVIPHGPGLTPNVEKPHFGPNAGEFRIGFITNFGVQKNFATLFQAARILRGAGRRFKIVLTLDEARESNLDLLTSARRLGIAGLIENHGLVSHEKIPAVYDSLDIFVFPSFCESFGFPMVEAMARGLPIVVAATPENKEMTQNAALAFAPLNSQELAAHLATLMDDDEERAKRARLSLERGSQFSWAEAARKTIFALDGLASPRHGLNRNRNVSTPRQTVEDGDHELPSSVVALSKPRF